LAAAIHQQKKNLYNEEKIKERGHYIEGDYGYLFINGKAYKLNLETFHIFKYINWVYAEDGYPCGIYMGVQRDLHLHVYIYYFPDYDRARDGTIDHADGEKLDNTIEKLRPANGSIQSQNVRRKNCMDLQSISPSGDKFRAQYGNESQSFVYLEDAMDYYNKLVRADPKIGEKGKFHIIQEGKKTTVADLYHKSVLKVEKLENATKGEIYSIFTINKDWREELDISSMREMFNENTLEYYREECIKLLKNEN